MSFLETPKALMNDYLARFQRKIAANAAAWRGFVQVHGDDPAALDRELANLTKAAQQALAEPAAWDEGLALVAETWAHVELRGLWQDWQTLLAEGLRISREIGRPQREARLLDQLGEVARLLGDNHRAEERFEAALALCRRLADRAGVGRALAHLSQVQLARNDWNAAARSCQEAALIFETLQQPDDEGLVHNNWGLVCQEQEQLEAALAHFEQAEAAFRAAGNLRGQAKTIANRAETLRRRRDWEGATGYLRQAIALYQQIGDPLHSANLQMTLSILLYETGRPEEALALSLEAEVVFRRLRHRPFLARVCNNHGIFLAALGRLAEAQDAFDDSARLHLANGDQVYAASSLTNCAEVLIDQDRLIEAQEHLTRAAELLDSLSERPRWVLHDYHTQQARLEAALGAQFAT